MSDFVQTSIPDAPKKVFPEKRNGIYFLKKDGVEYRLPSVTSITGEAMPKPQLMYWAAKTAARAALRDPTLNEEQCIAEIYKPKKEGGDRGALIHDFAEASDNGKPPDINGMPREIQGYARAFLKFQEDLAPVLVANEQKVVNFTQGYAGRMDRLYDMGGTVLIDFKTSKDYYPEMGLQLAAYKNSEFSFAGPEGPFVPMPDIQRAAVVLLSEAGNYTIKWVDEPFEAFLALKSVWEWLNADKLK